MMFCVNLISSNIFNDLNPIHGSTDRADNYCFFNFEN